MSVFGCLKKYSTWKRRKNDSPRNTHHGNICLFASGCCILILLLMGFYRDYNNLHHIFHNIKVFARNNCSYYAVNTRSCQAQKDRQLLEKMTRMYDDRMFSPKLSKVNSSQPCGKNTSTPCENACTLTSNTSARLQKLLFDPNLMLSDQQRENILSIGQNIKENDVIIVSAASSNHFYEMQAMFRNLHTTILPEYPDISLVLFDIGLTPYERNLTEIYCRCQVITFPTELFPPHVGVRNCYAWKPIVILATMAKAKKILVWQDASIRWYSDFHFYLDQTEIFGQQFLRFFHYKPITTHTLKQTFDYMGETPCVYAPFEEIPSGLSFNKNDDFVKRAMLEPWARCALEESCMCPVNPCKAIKCSKKASLHGCHRFDQSSMGIIIARLYYPDFDKIVSYAQRSVLPHRWQKDMTYFKP